MANETARAYNKMPERRKKRHLTLDPYAGGEGSGKKAKKDANTTSQQLKAPVVLSQNGVGAPGDSGIQSIMPSSFSHQACFDAFDNFSSYVWNINST
jgi:hypothetical protein